MEDQTEALDTGTIVRTLLLAGFVIEGAHRQPDHIEITCHRVDLIGARIPYLISFAAGAAFEPTQIDSAKRMAAQRGLIPVFVASQRSPGAVTWNDFAEALGGAVPPWQVLMPEYEDALRKSSRNRLPPGHKGEAWLVFEDLVEQGLEFVFGRKVRRLGGRTRGRPVSDMQAVTPQDEIIVVDTKASAEGFDATVANLRPLREYVGRQKERQRGHLAIRSALVVSSEFAQSAEQLNTAALQFNASTQVPIVFLSADDLAGIISLFRESPALRNAVLWNLLLAGGRLTHTAVKREALAASQERVDRAK